MMPLPHVVLVLCAACLLTACATVSPGPRLAAADRTGSDDAGEPRRVVADPEAACPSGEVPNVAFDDTRGNAHRAAVDCVAWHEITAGVNALDYAPARPVRRDQMASFLARVIEAAGVSLPDAADQGFTDIARSAHRDRINQLAAADVVAGVTSSTYQPTEPVRRDQMATFLVRTAEYVLDAELAARPAGFADVATTVHRASIDKAAEARIARGTTGSTFDPGATMRRDHMGAFLARTLGALAGEDLVAPRPYDFQSRTGPLPEAARTLMTGVSWQPGCPISLDDLALIEATHIGFDGDPHWGRMVVAAEIADDVAAVLAGAHRDGFPIRRMRLVDRYGADDDASMADNNTHAFNCRRVTGGARWSEHAYGTAIDINPAENPYVRGGQVLPPAGRAYLDRGDVRDGMLVRPGPVIDAFDELGWGWGGDWDSLKDYMHVSRSGR
jgi:hypothetical protein